jgi:hypothetical protein
MQTLKERSILMRKTIAFLAIALLVISVPMAVQADNADVYKGLEAKAAAAQQSLVASAAADGGGYAYAAVFTTYTVDDAWWTGLAVYNFSGSDNDLMIGVYDEDGDVACTGTFSIGPNGSMTDMLASFMTDGTLPVRGSIGLFGTQPFYADVVTGTSGGGFGQIEKAGEAY